MLNGPMRVPEPVEPSRVVAVRGAGKHREGVGVVRVRLDRGLVEAVRYVVEGQKRVAAQVSLISKLERDGCDTFAAEELLAVLRASQQRCERDLAMLRQRDGGAERAPSISAFYRTPATGIHGARQRS